MIGRETKFPIRSEDHDYQYTTYPAKDGTLIPMIILVPKKRIGESAPPFYDILFEMHGGGFVMGTENTTTITLTFLKEPYRFMIFSPRYRLAPEFRYPIAPQDCYDGLNWVREHAKEYGGNPERIMVGGSSSGATLAAVMTLLARDDKHFNPKPIIQILHVPKVEMFMSTKSCAEYSSTPVWNSALSLYARYLYVPNIADWKKPTCSPLYASSHSDLPPAFIIVDEKDPSHDDGVIYYEKLKKESIPVEIYSFDTYHSGEMMAWYVFGGYKKEIIECKEKLHSFITTYLPKN